MRDIVKENPPYKKNHIEKFKLDIKSYEENREIIFNEIYLVFNEEVLGYEENLRLK